MGDDGARGMLEMKQAGAVTMGQDEATCVVCGMPKEVIKLNGVDKILPRHSIAGAILNCARYTPQINVPRTLVLLRVNLRRVNLQIFKPNAQPPEPRKNVLDTVGMTILPSGRS
jgi:hypothetical protein